MFTFAIYNKHKNMKNIIILILLVITIISCKKMEVTPSINQKSTKDLVVPPTFDWKTSKEITLMISGLKEVDSIISNTIYIKSSIGDTVYYKDVIRMNGDYTIKFAVPSIETKVVLVYGSKTKIIDLISNEITFNFIIE